MNSLYNHALKQTQALQRDLNRFTSGEDTSTGLQGQITAAFGSLERSIADFEKQARREILTAKRELALTRVQKFRDELQVMRLKFDNTKKDQEQQQNQSNRRDLLGAVPPRSSGASPMEHPYQTPSPLDHAMRERNFAQSTESHLDDFISQAQHVLENLTDQHGILKQTQRRILDTANTLGLSQNVIRYIERRSVQDKWIFIAGVIITVGLMWAIVHYLG
ncbi:Protein transport protein bos1 [Umbelopsis nana]